MKASQQNKPNRNICVWTIQPERIWITLQRDKLLYVQPELSEGTKLWPRAYRWMTEQMQKRLSSYEGHIPWWGWRQPKPNPNLLFWKSIVQTEPEVCMELSIPAERVLLSHYPAWGMVLNNGFVGCTAQDYEDWETDLRNSGVEDGGNDLPEPWQSRVEAGWEAIFDLARLDAGGEWSAGWVQATFDRLALDDVSHVSEWRTQPRE